MKRLERCRGVGTTLIMLLQGRQWSCSGLFPFSKSVQVGGSIVALSRHHQRATYSNEWLLQDRFGWALVLILYTLFGYFSRHQQRRGEARTLPNVKIRDGSAFGQKPRSSYASAAEDRTMGKIDLRCSGASKVIDTARVFCGY